MTPAPPTAVARRLVLGLAVALTGCDDAAAPEAERLAARERWDRQRLVDYAFEYRASCFCTPHINSWHRVEVRGGRVVAATPVAPLPTEFGPPPPLDSWPTVDALFEAAATPRRGEIIGVTARFDPARGYPTDVDVRCSDRVADCGVAHFARRLVPLAR